jgi:glucuronoarabinoxylan endo-1,4-beta-xylanase
MRSDISGPETRRRQGLRCHAMGCQASSFRRIVLAVFACGLGARSYGDVATVDLGNEHQRISGFGTCSAWNGTLSSAEGTELWDTVQGAGLSLHRVMIEKTGTPSTDEQSNAKLATSYGVKVWGTPWYSQEAVTKGDYDTLYESSMQAWANDLVAGLKTMQSIGAPLYAISPQNESDLGWVKYDANAMALWVGKYLGPTVAAQVPATKVFASETCNWYGFSGYEPVLMADTNVQKYASILATHEYGGTVTAYPAIQAAGKEFWQTEIYDPITDVEDTGITSGLRICKLIHEALTVANMNAWHYWWIKPCSGCYNGALWAATNRPTKRLWVMGNWSRFVRPGFVRVDAPTAPASGLSLTAFRDSSLSKVVIVAFDTNTTSVTQEFTITGAVPSKLTAYITDSSRNIAGQTPQILGSRSFTYTFPPKSVTTLVLDMGPLTTAVSNGSFDSGSDGWTFNVWSGRATGSVVDGEYEVQVDSVGTSNHDIQLVQAGILLEQGKSYRVSFDAYASAARSLEANVEQNDSPWASYLDSLRTFGLTTTKTTYTYTFTMDSATDSNGRLTFNFGSSTGTVYLDNVSISVLDLTSVRAGGGSGCLAPSVRLQGGMLSVAYAAPAGVALDISVLDLAGRRRIERSFVSAGGDGSWSLPAAGLGKGIFVVDLRIDGRRAGQAKFIKDE